MHGLSIRANSSNPCHLCSTSGSAPHNAPEEAISYKSIIAPMPTITAMEERIVVNPKIMVGKPIIKGTRIPVDAILRRLADGMTISEILEEYPSITEEDIRAALRYVSEVIAGEEIIPMVETTA